MRPQIKQPLTVQEQYLRKHKSHHRQVSFLRFFLLGIFLLLWEVSADLDWIDSFFFSSPHRVILCPWRIMDRAVPSDAYRYHTVRNDPEFPAGIFRQSSVIHSAVVFQAAVGDLRALSGTAQQPSEIRSGSSVYCLAGHRDQHHHHCWNLCGSIRIHHQLLSPPFIR